MAHLMGNRRFKTEDDSRNSFILALITLGEGWHNNHHRYQASARNGFYWWELDITYYSLKVLSWTRLISNLKPVPKSVLEEGERAEHHASIVASRRVGVVHADHSALKRALPAAAAFAVATVQAAHGSPPVNPVEPPHASQTEHGT
jgi:stearoyl-CoA desaturase (delta-9 desaturase)